MASSCSKTNLDTYSPRHSATEKRDLKRKRSVDDDGSLERAQNYINQAKQEFFKEYQDGKDIPESVKRFFQHASVLDPNHPDVQDLENLIELMKIQN